MASTTHIRALVDEATANGIRDNNLRGIVAALITATLELCDVVDAMAPPAGMFVPDDFPVAPDPVMGGEA